jgi:hypothetical protein
MYHHTQLLGWEGVLLSVTLLISTSQVAGLTRHAPPWCPSYWLRWGLANLLLELASNRNPPSPYPPGITGMSHHVQPNNRCLLRAKENYIMWYQLTCCTTILIISDCQITKPTTWQSTEVIQMPKMIMNLTFCVPQTGYRKNPVIKARASENICFLRYFNYILATSEVFLSL